MINAPVPGGGGTRALRRGEAIPGARSEPHGDKLSRGERVRQRLVRAVGRHLLRGPVYANPRHPQPVPKGLRRLTEYAREFAWPQRLVYYN